MLIAVVEATNVPPQELYMFTAISEAVTPDGKPEPVTFTCVSPAPPALGDVATFSLT
jgi:hypothetical protein